MSKLVRAAFWIAAITIGVAFLARALFVDVWTIPADRTTAAAVAPTLRGGDVVLLWTQGVPTFGDLVRCTDPQDPKSFVVGRIVGKEGDRIEVVGRTLRVNGQSYDSQSACPEPEYTIVHPVTGQPTPLGCEEVAMGSGWHYRGFNPRPSPLAGYPVSADVQPAMVFLLSDDRDYHDDSRDFGQVPLASCKGRIMFRFWGASGYGDDPRRFEVIR